ncbi:DDE-type integrase/transposase/recombinase [Pseudomonas monteilii]|uniref:Integrase n=1 Tax=Pseudomonas monteilii TaxID=76759 RepID=A0A2N1IY52_9PSED|nr:DDE-type integrase/transposase/recombinase [Pseudomonas monteilii]PKI25663.1 integrase [Pseudomonas monteilii]RPD94740.1 integrase [Pseudomonas monteilii]
MRTFSLKVKLLATIRGVRMVLERRLLDRQLLFFDDFGEPTKLTEREFYEGYEKREIQVSPDQPYLGTVPYVRNAPRDIASFPQKDSEEALRRRTYLNALMGREHSKLPSNDVVLNVVQTTAAEIDDPRPPSVSTIRRWASKYLASDVTELVPKHAQKGRTACVQGELKSLLDDVIAQFYLKPELPTATVVARQYRSRIEERNRTSLPSDHLATPSESTVRRYIKRLDPFLVDEARLGKYAAKNKHRAAINVLIVDDILDRWEIDHTPMDVQLVDEDTGLVIGTPNLTTVIDRYSRMVMGYLIHLSPPNTETVLRAIERAIRPKAELLKRFPKVKNEWPAHGLPARIVCDNATEFHAENLIMGFNELGIEIMFPPSRKPTDKGGIERFFKTLNSGMTHNIPGTKFSNVRQRGDYPSEKKACFTLAQLEAATVKWFVDGYHQTPHHGLDMRTPAQVWAKAEANKIISLPVDLDALECILAKRTSVYVHHYGVEVATLFYHSSELAELRSRLKEGEKVSVRYRDEAGHVWVYDRFRSVFLQVPAKDKRLIGKSREMWQATKQALRAADGINPSFEATHKCYQDLMEEIDEARRSQKRRQRREAVLAKLDKEGRKKNADARTPAIAQISWPDSSIPSADLTPFKVSYRPPSGGEKE